MYVDAFELSGKLVDSGVTDTDDPQMKQVVDAVRAVAWCEPEDAMGTLTDCELFSVGCKVLARLDSVGKQLGPSHSSPRSTDIGPRAAA